MSSRSYKFLPYTRRQIRCKLHLNVITDVILCRIIVYEQNLGIYM